MKKKLKYNIQIWFLIENEKCINEWKSVIRNYNRRKNYKQMLSWIMNIYH